jgi:hypothetical protein
MNVEEEIMRLRERVAALERQVDALQQGPRVIPWPYVVPNEPHPVEPYFQKYEVTCKTKTDDGCFH